MDKTLIAGVFAVIGALVGAAATARTRRLEAEARSRAALESAVVEYVTALEELLISLDMLGLKEMPGERHLARFVGTSIGQLVTAPVRLVIYLLFPVLSTTRQANRLRRASRRLALTADEDLLGEVKAIERLLAAERKDLEWANHVLAASRRVTVAARRAISPPRSRLPWRRRDNTEVERLLVLPADGTPRLQAGG